MILNTTQGNVTIDLLKNFTKIGIKVSGGLDSAIVLYMLGKYANDERSDIIIVPNTVQEDLHPYNKHFSEKIIDFCKKEFPLVNISNQLIEYTPKGEDFIEVQKGFTKRLINEHIVDININGVTLNPPINFYFKNGTKMGGPSDDRGNITLPERNVVTPLNRIDKKGVMELYKQLGVLDTLFPLTYSCVEADPEKTNNFRTHCGNCWWCKERIYGFGKLHNIYSPNYK